MSAEHDLQQLREALQEARSDKERLTRADATEDLLRAARSVVSRWRDVKRADDEIALLEVALSQFASKT